MVGLTFLSRHPPYKSPFSFFSQDDEPQEHYLQSSIDIPVVKTENDVSGGEQFTEDGEYIKEEGGGEYYEDGGAEVGEYFEEHAG